MVTAWLIFRLVKWVGIGAFAAGLALAAGPARPRTRLGGGLGLATVGLLATWMGGYGVMKAMDLSFQEPHIFWAMLASLVGLAGGALGGWVGSRVLPLALATFGFVSSIGLMTAKGDPTALLVLGGVIPAVLAGAAAGVGAWLGPAERSVEEAKQAVHVWFSWIARAEGISLLVLFGVFMPLKYGAGIEIDGGDGWVGWIHGVLVFFYMTALGIGVIANRWGIVAGILGFIASLVPFGTFVFEWWLGRRMLRADGS